MHRQHTQTAEQYPYLSIAGAVINYGFIVYCFSKSCTSTDLTWTSAKRTFGVQLYFSGALSIYAIWAAYRLSQKDPINSTARGAGWILLGELGSLKSNRVGTEMSVLLQPIRSCSPCFPVSRLARARIYASPSYTTHFPLAICCYPNLGKFSSSSITLQ